MTYFKKEENRISNVSFYLLEKIKYVGRINFSIFRKKENKKLLGGKNLCVQQQLIKQKIFILVEH